VAEFDAIGLDSEVVDVTLREGAQVSEREDKVLVLGRRPREIARGGGFEQTGEGAASLYRDA
jgi:hypothetical protein